MLRVKVFAVLALLAVLFVPAGTVSADTVITLSGSIQPWPIRLDVRSPEGTVRVGESVQYQAVVVYSDGSEKDVTQEVVWSVSDPAVAVINNKGLATGLKAGQVTVTASWQTMVVIGKG